jgi:hypothetical protein
MQRHVSRAVDVPAERRQKGAGVGRKQAKGWRTSGREKKSSAGKEQVESRARTFKCLWGPGIDAKE